VTTRPCRVLRSKSTDEAALVAQTEQRAKAVPITARESVRSSGERTAPQVAPAPVGSSSVLIVALRVNGSEGAIQVPLHEDRESPGVTRASRTRHKLWISGTAGETPLTIEASYGCAVCRYTATLGRAQIETKKHSWVQFSLRSGIMRRASSKAG
jgi:hypothetical protein